MEAEDLDISHHQLTEERVRLLEIQVASLISDVIMLKGWKSEMSKLNLLADISCRQSEAVVPTSDIKVTGTIMKAANVQKTTQECSGTSISPKQPEPVVPTSDLMQEQIVSDSLTGTANNQKAIQSSNMSISCIQPEAVVPTSNVKEEQVVGDSLEPAKDQKIVQECSDTSISCIQPEAVVPVSNVKEEQVVNDTIMETAEAQKATQSSDAKQKQIVSDKIIETANGQMAAEIHSESRMSENLDCISSGSTLENASTEMCENETPDLKCEVSPLEETTALSGKDAPVVQAIRAVDTQERRSETPGASKKFKEDSRIDLIEEEELTSSLSERVPSEQEMKQSGSSKASQLRASVSVKKSEEHGTALCKIGNKHSVLEKLVKSTVQHNASEGGDKTHSAMASPKHIFDRQNTDSMIPSPEKQKTELHSSVASSVQANQENDLKQKLQHKDKPKEVEKNALIAYMMKHEAFLQRKEVKEEQIMQDTSVTVKEKKCSTCQCKIATITDTKESEEDDSGLREMVKKMSREKLEKKYLQLKKRHQTLVNAICDPSTLTLPDNPHALLNAARDGNIEGAILFTFSATMMDFRDEDGYSPLHLAVWNEHIPICKLLLAYNMPANVQDKQGNTPLHFAARKGNLEICKVLLDFLAPLNGTNACGTTPLHCAVKEGHAKVCYLLVSKGASLNLGDKWNNTALHMAACNGFLEICQFLVKQGVDVNAQNSVGSTPLHNACRPGHFKVVQYLVKNGAHLSIKCNKGKTPKEVINTLTHSSILEWLTKWEKRICSDLNSILVNIS